MNVIGNDTRDQTPAAAQLISDFLNNFWLSLALSSCNLTWKDMDFNWRKNRQVPLGVNQKRRVGNSQTGHGM